MTRVDEGAKNPTVGWRSAAAWIILLTLAASPARATVTVTTTGKGAAGVTLTSGTVTIAVTEAVDFPAPPGGGVPILVPPLGVPAFALDLFDDDNWCTFADDCRGVDVTDGTPGVTTTGWVFSSSVAIGTGMRGIYTYTWTVPTFTTTPPPNCSDIGPGDPTIEVMVGRGNVTSPAGGTVAFPIGGTVEITAPGVPSIGAADVGVTGPSRLANSSVLQGLPIAAFSRGDDEISSLGSSVSGSGAALYFALDPNTQTFPSGFEAVPGLAFVLDSQGRVWKENVYGGNVDPGQSLGSVRYLNINTAAPESLSPTSEMFFVLEGSDKVKYTPNSDPSTAITYVDLNSAAPVTALAVQDVGVQGVFDAGDVILYAVEGSSAIFRLEFGGTPQFLTAYGLAFNGSTTLDPNYLGNGDGDECCKVDVGSITALSVASLSGSQVTPADRVLIDFRESAIPEPGTHILLVLGSLGLLGYGWWRKRVRSDALIA